MAIKKYLYREDEAVFKKIDNYKKLMNDNGIKCSTKDAITALINKGYDAEIIVKVIDTTDLEHVEVK
jgi:hypothetical protein